MAQRHASIILELYDNQRVCQVYRNHHQVTYGICVRQELSFLPPYTNYTRIVSLQEYKIGKDVYPSVLEVA